MDYSYLVGAWPLLLRAFSNTALYSVAAVAIGLPIGILACVMVLSRNHILRALGSLYVSFFRGVPLIVLLFIAYYALPSVGVRTTATQAAILALALCEGAYLAECLRGGFIAIPKGQLEAAAMAGLTRWQTFRHVTLPNVFRLTLPSVINEVTLAIKASSLISLIGILEITRVSQNLASSTFRPLEVYLFAALLYLFVTSGVTLISKFLSSRLNRGIA